ncbi:MAG: hypothetical protein AABM29_08345 [Actinomycetota bacterium]
MSGGISTRRGVLAAALGAALGVLGLALLQSPPGADASCGGVQTDRPSKKKVKKINPGGRPPLAIGDSSMLLALPNLAHSGFKVNARGCRQFTEGIRVVKQAKRRGELPHLVAIALGADAFIQRSQIERTLHIMGRKRVLTLVTPRELGGGSGNDARVVRRAGAQHPHRVQVLDWVNFSEGHSGWFQPDGLHLTFPGAAAFAKLFRKALPLAEAGEFPGPR